MLRKRHRSVPHPNARPGINHHSLGHSVPQVMQDGPGFHYYLYGCVSRILRILVIFCICGYIIMTRCLIGNGDDDDYSRNNDTLPTWSQKTRSENVVQAARDSCGCFHHDGTGARIAYLVTLHNRRTLEDSATLVQRIATSSNIILIHMDRKLPLEEYESSRLNEFVNGKCQACGANVLVQRKFNVKWGEWSMNEPTLWSMMELVTNSRFVGQWDVFMNLSADSLPVYTPQVLSHLFAPRATTTTKNSNHHQQHHHHHHDSDSVRNTLYGMNFVTSSSCMTGLLPTPIKAFPRMWHKRRHYEQHGIFEILDGIGSSGTSGNSHDVNETTKEWEIHFGSQWMILTREFVEYIVMSLQDKDSPVSRFKAELIARGVLMSDETFFPTVLANHPWFRQTMPIPDKDGRLRITSLSNIVNVVSLKSVRYERMDENIPDAFGNVVTNQKYEVPHSASNVDPPRAWGPYYLGVYDLGSIRESGALFIRKVSQTIDPNLYHVFPVTKAEEIPNILWPVEVKISEKVVDWEPILKSTRHMRES